MSSTTPTLKAAVKYALELQRKADQEIARDPYASPYRPTEASVRKLASRMAGEATRDLPVDATPEQVAEAKASGPQRAILYMRMRAKQHATAQHEQNEIAARSEARHKRRQEQARKRRDEERAHLRPGQRIDQAIARLRLVASPAAGKIGRDTPDADPDQAPPWSVDTAQRAVAIARRAVREIEEYEDEMKVRDMRAA